MVKSMTGFALFLEHLHHGFVGIDKQVQKTTLRKILNLRTLIVLTMRL